MQISNEEITNTLNDLPDSCRSASIPMISLKEADSLLAAGGGVLGSEKQYRPSTLINSADIEYISECKRTNVLIISRESNRIA